MMYSTLTEEELVKGCCSGERSMQQALFIRFSARMMGVCRRYTASKMDAEDQLHEGFMIIFQQIQTFKGGSLEGWMRKIMLNQCLAAFRKQKRDRIWINDISGEMENKIGSGKESWYDFLEAKQLVNLIDSLPMGAKTVFNLAAVEGYSHAEIAEMLGIQESASRSQLARARKTLQEACLKHYNSNNDERNG